MMRIVSSSSRQPSRGAGRLVSRRTRLRDCLVPRAPVVTADQRARAGDHDRGQVRVTSTNRPTTLGSTA